jgi:hypothetical protein
MGNYTIMVGKNEAKVGVTGKKRVEAAIAVLKEILILC